MGGSSDAATIAFLRHAEMKHGRVAMLAFLGFVFQANQLTFPWCTIENGFPPVELSPPEQWDVLDPKAKFQLFFFIGMLEIWSESAPGQPHYMRPGGVPGKFPKFLDAKRKRIPGLPVDLWDPLGFIDNMTPEVRNIKLAKEVNNGRLAMLGVTSFFVESKVSGAVPLLSFFHLVKPYEGEYMMPFRNQNKSLRIVPFCKYITPTGEDSQSRVCLISSFFWNRMCECMLLWPLQQAG